LNGAVLAEQTFAGFSAAGIARFNLATGGATVSWLITTVVAGLTRIDLAVSARGVRDAGLTRSRTSETRLRGATGGATVTIVGIAVIALLAGIDVTVAASR